MTGARGQLDDGQTAPLDLFPQDRGDELDRLMEEMRTITAANVMLAEYHRDRRLALS